MKHIFISYQSDSIDFVSVLVGRLEKQDYKAWSDDDISPGEEWRNKIDKAILNSWAVIVVMTPKARASEYVTYEWSMAIGLGKAVIPVMLQSTPIHPRLELLQHLDFTSQKLRPWDRLTARLSMVYRTGTEQLSPVSNESPGAIEPAEPVDLSKYIFRENLLNTLADLLHSDIITIKTLHSFRQNKVISTSDIVTIREIADRRS